MPITEESNFYKQQTPEEKEMLHKAHEIYDETGYWFYCGVLCVKKDKLWGVINPQGELLFDFMFIDKPLYFECGYARAYIGRHKCGMIDNKGNVVVDFKYDNVFPYEQDEYVRVEKGYYWGTLDRDGKEHIKPKMKFQEIGTFHDCIARARIDTKWGLIDTEGNHISAFKYLSMEDEENGLFFVEEKSNTYGYINRKGELVENPKENSQEDKLELNKYNLAYYFIPRIMRIIGENEDESIFSLTDLNVIKACVEEMTFFETVGFEWDELKIDMVKFVDDGRVAILYEFPEPDRESKAVCGAIIITDEGYYYVILECCVDPGSYMLRFISLDESVPLGMYNIEPAKENFIDMLKHTLPFVMKCNPKSVFNIPEGYQEIDVAPEDPEGCINIVKHTSRANCYVRLFPIKFESSMPLDNRVVIGKLNESLSESQATIEVDNGKTAKGYKYIYHITKEHRDPSGVNYYLMLHVYYGNVSLCVHAMFEETGTTGERDSLIFALMQKEGKVTVDDNGINGWCFDPYDENSTRSYQMNLSELSCYDGAFPDHPLSQCRALMKYVIENQ